MGLGSVCVTVPAVAAAVGFFFFDRSHSRANQVIKWLVFYFFATDL